MHKIELANISRIHFVGIGGSSMSGLACFMLNRGKMVSGSDSSNSTTADFLTSLGAAVNIPHDGEVIKKHNPELVVFTVAVRDDNPELLEAYRMGMPVIDRAEFLGLLMKDYRFGIAVAGTHGKTTTTSMIASILVDNHLDPSIHIGGTLPLIGGNTKIGNSSYFVTEACEYHDSFLRLLPNIAVVLNVEHDHVDYFKTFEQFKNSFRDFVNLVPEDGCAVVCADDASALEICADARCRVITYGIDYGIDEQISPSTVTHAENCRSWTARNIVFGPSGSATYDLFHVGEAVCQVVLGTVGEHNVRNSLASIAAAFELGIKPSSCLESLLNFTGAKRRFEIKGFLNVEKDGVSGQVKVVDDYAHHPTEITTTLAAAKNSVRGLRDFRSLQDFRGLQSPAGRVILAFQPHTYTRTRELMDLFATSFGDADMVLLADIFASRESDPGNINSGMLAEQINKSSNNCTYFKGQDGFEDIAAYIKSIMTPGDLVITMGAGDIYKVADLLLNS